MVSHQSLYRGCYLRFYTLINFLGFSHAILLRDPIRASIFFLSSSFSSSSSSYSLSFILLSDFLSHFTLSTILLFRVKQDGEITNYVFEGWMRPAEPAATNSKCLGTRPFSSWKFKYKNVLTFVNRVMWKITLNHSRRRLLATSLTVFSGVIKARFAK